jgi:hypothetical protein
MIDMTGLFHEGYDTRRVFGIWVGYSRFVSSIGFFGAGL